MSIRYIFKFRQRGYIRLIGHLDLVDLFARSIKRASYEVLYTKAFNPRPLISIVNPLGLGVESDGEFIHIEFKEEIDVEKFINDLNVELPEGLDLIFGVKNSMKSLEKEIFYSEFEFILIGMDKDMDLLEKKLKEFMDLEEIYINRSKRNKRKTINYKIGIKDLIYNLSYEIKGKDLLVHVFLETRYGAYLNPKDFIRSFVDFTNLDIDIDYIHIIRKGQYFSDFKEISQGILKE